MQKSSFIREEHIGRFWKLFPSSCVFIALFFTTFSSAFATGLSEQLTDPSGDSEEISALLFDAVDHLGLDLANSNLPEPIPEEPEEESDEKEDNFDEDFKTLNRDYAQHQSLLANVWMGATAQAFQHRKTIPFFILFHSWKSFLI